MAAEPVSFLGLALAVGYAVGFAKGKETERQRLAACLCSSISTISFQLALNDIKRNLH
jgi:hypothetical protein